MSSVNLSQIEGRFSSAVSGTISEETRADIVGLLKTAFKDFKIKAEKDSFELAKIFYLYGRAIYGGDMVAPHNVLKLSTALQLAGMEKLDVKLLPSMAECQELDQVAQLQCPNEVDELLMQGDAEMLADHAEAFSFACSLRWLLHTEQNLKGLSGNLDRLEKLYGLARAIQEKVNTPDSKWEVAGIIYNGERWLVSQKDPENIDKALEVLDKLEPFIERENGSIRSQLLKAQIENMRAKLLGEKIGKATGQEKKDLFAKQFDHRSKADKIATGLTVFGGDQFLATLFKSNLISTGLDCLANNVNVTNLNDLEYHANSVLNDMEREKYSHFYHPLFLINVAQLKMTKGENIQALKLLNKAAEVNNNYPQNVNFEQVKQAIASMKGQIGVAPAWWSSRDVLLLKICITSAVICVGILTGRGRFRR